MEWVRREKIWRVVALLDSPAAEAAHCEEPEHEHEAEGWTTAGIGRGRGRNREEA